MLAELIILFSMVGDTPTPTQTPTKTPTKTLPYCETIQVPTNDLIPIITFAPMGTITPGELTVTPTPTQTPTPTITPTQSDHTYYLDQSQEVTWWPSYDPNAGTNGHRSLSSLGYTVNSCGPDEIRAVQFRKNFSGTGAKTSESFVSANLKYAFLDLTYSVNRMFTPQNTQFSYDVNTCYWRNNTSQCTDLAIYTGFPNTYTSNVPTTLNSYLYVGHVAHKMNSHSITLKGITLRCYGKNEPIPTPTATPEPTATPASCQPYIDNLGNDGTLADFTIGDPVHSCFDFFEGFEISRDTLPELVLNAVDAISLPVPEFEIPSISFCFDRYDLEIIFLDYDLTNELLFLIGFILLGGLINEIRS